MAKSEVIIVIKDVDKSRLMRRALAMKAENKSTLYKFIDEGFGAPVCPKPGYCYLRWSFVNWDAEQSKGVKLVMDFLKELDDYDFYRLGTDDAEEMVEKGRHGLVCFEKRLAMK